MSSAVKTLKVIFILALSTLVVLVALFLIQLIPQIRISSLVNMPTQNNAQVEPVYPMPNVTYLTEQASETSYKINIVRPSGFPPIIQSKVDAFYEGTKSALLAGAQAQSAIESADPAQPKVVYSLLAPQPLITSYRPYVFIVGATEEYTGGKMTAIQYLHIAYDVRTRQEISLEQFFADPTAMYQSIADAAVPATTQAIAQKIFANRDPKSITANEIAELSAQVRSVLQPSADMFQNWYITKDSLLVFVFAPGQIVQRELGQLIVGIPLNELKNSLNLDMFKM